MFLLFFRHKSSMMLVSTHSTLLCLFEPLLCTAHYSGWLTLDILTPLLRFLFGSLLFQPPYFCLYTCSLSFSCWPVAIPNTFRPVSLTTLMVFSQSSGSSSLPPRSSLNPTLNSLQSCEVAKWSAPSTEEISYRCRTLSSLSQRSTTNAVARFKLKWSSFIQPQTWWSSRTIEPYLSLAVHVIDNDFELKNSCLQTQHFLHRNAFKLSQFELCKNASIILF